VKYSLDLRNRDLKIRDNDEEMTYEMAGMETVKIDLVGETLDSKEQLFVIGVWMRKMVDHG
jgi:hypothetical protein